MHSMVTMADLFASEEIDVTLQIDEGQARCDFCQGDYSLQLQVICGACERPLCPFCAARSQRIYHCPKCRPTRRACPPGDSFE